MKKLIVITMVALFAIGCACDGTSEACVDTDSTVVDTCVIDTTVVVVEDSVSVTE